MQRLLFIAFNLFLILFSLSCQLKKEGVYRKSEFLMDTIVTITVVSDSEKKADDAIKRTFKEIKDLEGLFNFFSPESEISEINRKAAVTPVKLSADTFHLLEKALEVSTRTDGAFDITVGVVVKLYDFHNKTRPPDSLIKEKLPFVNYRNVILNKKDQTVFLKKKGMLVDPGGIAKGFAADRAIEILKSEGIGAALVAVAGDIRGYGLKPDGKPWKVGIRDPRGESIDDIIATIDLRDMAISTSGDYERFFIDNGIRVHHLIDPGTGYPARGTMSVTVVAPLTVYTDSLATALFVSGTEKGLKIADRFGYDALMIDEQGKIHMTDSLREKIEFTKGNI